LVSRRGVFTMMAYLQILKDPADALYYLANNFGSYSLSEFLDSLRYYGDLIMNHVLYLQIFYLTTMILGMVFTALAIKSKPKIKESVMGSE